MQGIIDFTGIKTCQYYFTFRRWQRVFKSCLPRTLNGIAVKIQYVSSILVVLHTGLNYQSRWEYKHDDVVASLDCADVNEYIIYVTTRSVKSTHQTAKLPKHNKLKVSRIREKLIFLALPNWMVRLRPQKHCLFRFLCKSFRSC